MIGKLFSTAIAKRMVDGDRIPKGLLVGALVPAIARRAFGPLGLAVAGGYVAKKAWDRRNRDRTGPTTTNPA
jgi:hypothetical protein